MADPFVPTPETVPQEFLPQEEVSDVEADERAFEAEAADEEQNEFLEKEEPEKAPTTPIPTKSASAQPVAQTPAKDAVTLRVEKILEEGLGPLYASLPDSAKPKFKQKGEVAANEITGMVRSLRFQAKRALQLIRDWLLTIPGVNKFFLEQEAKIKVDMLAQLIQTQKEERNKQP